MLSQQRKAIEDIGMRLKRRGSYFKENGRREMGKERI
jgi:hypothetical protein